MSRAKIVTMLYVLTFLFSAYVKFTKPDLLDQNHDLIRNHDVVDLSQNEMQYSWVTSQTQAEFEYTLYKQIGAAIIPDSVGGCQVTCSIEQNELEKAVLTSLDKDKLLLTFTGDPSRYGVSIIERSSRIPQFDVPDTTNIVIPFQSRGISEINIYKLIPIGSDTSLTINYKQTREDQDDRKVFINAYNKCYINLDTRDVRCDSVREAVEVKEKSLKFFKVGFDFTALSTQASGNYVEAIDEKINNSKTQLRYIARNFQIRLQGSREFAITYPTDDIQAPVIPVGIPYKQTIIANRAIDRFNLVVGSTEYETVDLTQSTSYVNDETGLKVQAFEGRTILSAEYPVRVGDNTVTIYAFSGDQQATRTWEMDVEPLMFGSWPPIKPKKWSNKEKELYESFRRQFPDQKSYERAPDNVKRQYPLVYEAREILLTPHFKNVDFGSYRRCVLTTSAGNTINISPDDMHSKILKLPKDITRVNMKVYTAYGDKDFTFYVKQVIVNGDQKFTQNPTIYPKRISMGNYSVLIQIVDFFGEIINLKSENLVSSSGFQYKINESEKTGNLFQVNTGTDNFRDQITVNFVLDYYGPTALRVTLTPPK